MPAGIWSFLLSLIVAALCSIGFCKRLFADKEVIKAIKQAGQVILPERDIEKARENAVVRTTMNALARADVVFDLNALILNDMRNMYNLMGLKKRPERELALFIVYGLAGALPILLVPVITGFMGYTVMYPAVAGILVYQKYLTLQKAYRKWQRKLSKTCRI